MKTITKKVQEQYFQAIISGKKRFEVRLADFDAKPGDTLVLLEQKEGSKELTGRKLKCEILFTFNTKEVEKFYSKEELEKHGPAILAVRRKFHWA